MTPVSRARCVARFLATNCPQQDCKIGGHVWRRLSTSTANRPRYHFPSDPALHFSLTSELAPPIWTCLPPLLKPGCPSSGSPPGLKMRAGTVNAPPRCRSLTGQGHGPRSPRSLVRSPLRLFLPQPPLPPYNVCPRSNPPTSVHYILYTSQRGQSK